MAIPFSFLVIWSKSHKDEDTSLTYVNTLNKKNSYQTVEEILSSQDPGKKISDLRAYLRTKINEIEMEYSIANSNSVTVNVTPVILGVISGTASFYDCLKAFINDYYDKRHKSDSLIKNTVFRESFIPQPFHTEVPTDEKLAQGVSSQTVRDYRKSCIRECRDLLIEGKIVDNYSADPSFVREMSKIKDQFGMGISYETAKKITGIQDDRTLNFLMKLLNLDLTRNDTNIKIRAIVPQALASHYCSVLGQVLSFFRSDPVFIRFDEDVVPELKKITKDKSADLFETFKSVILRSEEFVRYKTKGQDYIALRWDLLQFVAPQVCWIVFEKGAFDLKSAMPTSEILKQYNVYAKLFKTGTISRAQITPTHLKNCWRLMNIGRQEYWMIRESEDENFDIKEFTRALFYPGMTYAQFIQAAKDSGLIPIYPETTVANCYPGGSGNTSPSGTPTQRIDWTQMLNETESLIKTLNKPMKSSDIIRILYNNHGLSSSLRSFSASFLDHVRKASPRFVTHSCSSGRDGVWVGLSGMIIPPESYRDIIKRKATELLKNATNHTMGQGDLYKIFEPLVPDNLNKASALSSIFSDTNCFLRNGGGKKGNNITITLNPLLLI